jgi:hypothetical protein
LQSFNRDYLLYALLPMGIGYANGIVTEAIHISISGKESC